MTTWEDGTPMFTTCRRCRRDGWDIMADGCVYGCWNEDGTHYTFTRYDVPYLPADEVCMETCVVGTPCPHGMDCDHVGAGRLTIIEELHDVYFSDEMWEERVERTGDKWDDLADCFFEEHGWTKPHMAYEVIDETLQVATAYGVWEDTGINKKDAHFLLCTLWDRAEYEAFLDWVAEVHGIETEVVA